LAQAERAMIVDILKALDAFPKVDTSHLKQTRLGGISTLLTYLLMAFLLLSHLTGYLWPHTRQRYLIDNTQKGEGKLYMSIDMVISTECDKLMVIYSDEESGATQMINNLLQMADVEGECKINGIIHMSRNNGKIQIIPLLNALGQLGRLLVQLDPSVNFSHRINHLLLAPSLHDLLSISKDKSPLSGKEEKALVPHERFSYFVSILPTYKKSISYSDALEESAEEAGYQYALTGFRSGKVREGSGDNPGLLFAYDLQPIAVHIEKCKRRCSFLHFLVEVVGILGGIFVCSGIVTSLISLSISWVTLIWSRCRLNHHRKKHFSEEKIEQTSDISAEDDSLL